MTKRVSFADLFLLISSSCSCVALWAPGLWSLVGVVGFFVTFGYALWITK